MFQFAGAWSFVVGGKAPKSPPVATGLVQPWPRPGRVQKYCDLHTPLNKHCNFRALICKVKFGCSFQRIWNINNLTMGVGRGSFALLEVENWHFHIKFLAKSRFLSFERVKWIFVTLPFPWKNIFGYTWKNPLFVHPWKKSLRCPWTDCIKACNHTLLDFLHLSRKRYIFFHNNISRVGMLHWTRWLLTHVRHGSLYRALNPTWQATDYLTIFGQKFFFFFQTDIFI